MKVIKNIYIFFLSFFICLSGAEHNPTLGFYYEQASVYQGIQELREGIDAINLKIIDLMTKRTALAMRVGDLKSEKNQIANDSERILKQLKRIKEVSLLYGLPVSISESTFKALIESSTDFEQQYINQSKKVCTNTKI